jgi:DNA-binding transcriptional LysR family regulator
MADRTLESLDLNKVLALHWLLEEGNVTRAARRMGTSQPAMSRALAELREWLNDPLLVRNGRTLVRTAVAETLRPRLAATLAGLRELLRQPEPFEPARARGIVRIATTDYSAALLSLAWLGHVAPHAPGLDVQFVAPERVSAEDLVRGTVDLVVVPSGQYPREQRFVRRHLLHEDYVSVVRAGHPAARQKLSLARFAALDHVLVSVGTDEPAPVDKVLASFGMVRRVSMRVSSFLLAPLVLEHSDAVATLPSRLVAAWGKGLARVRLPVSIPGFSLDLGWHPRNTPDPRHKFVREALFAWAEC